MLITLPVPIWRGTVDGNGDLSLARQDAFDRYRAAFKDQEVEVIIRRHRKTRSIRQNRYYWRIVLPLLAERCGYRTREQMHMVLKRHFLTERGESVDIVRSTRSLNVAEFNEYLEACCELAAWLGVVIPAPGEAV